MFFGHQGALFKKLISFFIVISSSIISFSFICCFDYLNSFKGYSYYKGTYQKCLIEKTGN